MSQTMKALVKAKPEKGLWLQEVAVPDIAPDEVLIRIERTAICGTDMHIYGWDEWSQKNVPVPLVVGHEYGGTVAAIGSTVKRVKVGDRVTGEGHVVGRRSRNARAGRFHLDPDSIRVQVNVENLTDTDYFPSAHTDDQITVGAPINAKVSVTGRF